MGGDYFAKIFFEVLGVFLEGDIGGFKNYSLVLQFFVKAVVDDFGFELSSCSCEKFAFGLGDSEFFEGFFDFGGDVVPVGLGAVLGADVVVDIGEVDVGEITAPGRHGFVLEYFEGF